MDHLIEPLKNLGLSEKEVRIYLALLQLGPSTPYSIAKKADLKRPTAYVIAEELVEKGLIVHVPGEERRRYIARSPEIFIEEREEKIAAAKRILPELRSFQKDTAEKPSILYFEGVGGLRQAYQYRQKELHGKEIVGFFASAEDASPGVIDVFIEWNAYKAKYGPKVRGLTVDHSALQSFAPFLAKSGLEVKFMPPELYSAKVSIESCDDRFVRICLIESAQTLIIESPKFAQAMRQAFELVWTSLNGKYDTPHALVLSEEPKQSDRKDDMR